MSPRQAMSVARPRVWDASSATGFAPEPPPCSRLPVEVWLYIFALATADCSPVSLAQAQWFQYQPIVDPFYQIRRFWSETRAFTLVNKAWNFIATDLLFGCISIDSQKHFDRLQCRLGAFSAAATRVRAVHLSSTRFDHNRMILSACSQAQVIVLPDLPPYADTRVGSDSGRLLDCSLKLPALKYIYWTESEDSAGALRHLIRAAPNLRGLHLADSAFITERSTNPTGLCLQSQSTSTSTIPSLRRLTLGPLGPLSAGWIMGMGIDTTRITTMTCCPTLIRSLPYFPSLRSVNIFGSRKVIDLRRIVQRCPALEEISFDVWNRFAAGAGASTTVDSSRRPQAAPLSANSKAPPSSASDPRMRARARELSVIRIHSAVSVLRDSDWSNITELFGILTETTDLEFPRARRVVLYNMWRNVVEHGNFKPRREALRARGCRLEFPEGCVLV
ncbi:hypothetical protein HMN09_00195400 [Mycena chlorophos]|uniref:Uncharacterized protein n=1 Tax=Mycena chlorophos TaxID=658473 RepID=A0A8H6TL99_MYCCL|nr:hypothetical protein HMN09_00195400 [Mycena chlorophos]